MNKKSKRTLIVFSFLLAAFICLVLTQYIGEYGVVSFTFGFAFLIAYCVLAIADLRKTGKEEKAALRDIIKDSRAVAWVWIGGFALTLPFCALIYFCLGYPFSLIADVVNAGYTLTGTMGAAWTATQLILSYILALVLVFVVVNVIMNSKHTGEY